MNKVINYLQNKLPGKGPSEARVLAPPVDVFDVSTSLTDIDLSALDVLKWTPAHMTRAERLLMYTMAFTLRPKRYLEIGTFQGGSALIVAAALDTLDLPSRMVFVDPRPQIAPEHWEKLQHRSTLITGFSPDSLPQAKEAAGGLFDLVLIDGDHSYKGLTRDAEGVLPYVSDGAYLLFHDSFYFEVAQGIDDFVQRYADRVVDFGPMTREVTVQQEPNSKPIHWGGLRMVQVRHNSLSH